MENNTWRFQKFTITRRPRKFSITRGLDNTHGAAIHAKNPHSLRITPQVKNTTFVLNRPIGQNKITIKLKNTDTAYNTDSTQK